MIFTRDSSVKGFVDAVSLCSKFRSQASLEGFARSLGTVARRAVVHGNKREVVRVVDTLLTLPLSAGLHNLARYYEIQIPGRFRDPNAEILALEGMADRLPNEYRPRPLLAAAERYRDQGRHGNAVALYLEAIKAAHGVDLLTEIQALRGLAIVRSVLGDHRAALNLLRGIFSSALLLRGAYEPEYLAYLNSIAVELTEVGRVGEANAVIDYVLGAANAAGCLLPNWVDTKQEVLAKIGQPAPPLVFAFSRPLEKPQELAAAQTPSASVARDPHTSSKKFLVTGFALNPAACIPTKRLRARVAVVKPQFVLPRETRPGSSHSPRAPPPAR
ncbi:MAG TPA: tetratricopeptide repeat protein [Blastocatellia bacterium]|nr:tetratricopeptide repeat protein [Blastocatellia bacterium]